MRKLFLLGILAATVCLAALFLFFAYLKPIPIGQKSTPPVAGFVGDVPIGYFDLRGQKKVLIDIKGFDFTPQRILISPGTEMIWRNDDRVFHSVNFDSQPASPPASPNRGESLGGPTSPGSLIENSALLKTGELFIKVLDSPGTYKYHSSDNPETITGIIIVK